MRRIESPAIYDALRLRYGAPQYALFLEVANGTGSNIRRYCDALAMSLFPSRGLDLHGFEVKVSKQDWKRELANPHKVEEGIYKFCDCWWIVAPQGIVVRDELPKTWGLLELQPYDPAKPKLKPALRQVVAAPTLKPQQMSRSFIAALLRRADEANSAIIERAVREQVDERTQGIQQRIQAGVDERTRHLRERLAIVEAIERQLGISLTDYSAHEGYGRILKALDAIGITRTAWRGLGTLRQSAEALVKHIDGALAEFDAVAPSVPAPKEKDAA